MNKPENTRIRVAYVISSWGIGGTERMFTHLIPNMDKSRFETCLVCFNSPSYASREWQASGIEVHHLNVDKLMSLKGAVRMMSFLRRWRPDVVAVGGLRANLMSRLPAWLCRVPVFVTLQRGIEDWKSKIAVLLEKTTSVFVDLYIGNAEACCRMLATRERIPERKLYVIPNGIDFKIHGDVEQQAQNIQREFKFPSNSVIVGTVGRLEPVKGHDDFLAAAQIILRSHPNTFFVIVGEDRRNGELQALAKSYGIGDNVLFSGYRKEVAVWLKCFDIFVLPSLSEGMPVSVAEAMFMGLPVVATDVGGVNELVDDKKTGLLVPKSQPQWLAEAITELIKKPEKARQLGLAGLQRAKENFTAEKMVRQYENIFAKLIAESKSSRRLR